MAGLEKHRESVRPGTKNRCMQTEDVSGRAVSRLSWSVTFRPVKCVKYTGILQVQERAGFL